MYGVTALRGLLQDEGARWCTYSASLIHDAMVRGRVTFKGLNVLRPFAHRPNDGSNVGWPGTTALRNGFVTAVRHGKTVWVRIGESIAVPEVAAPPDHSAAVQAGLDAQKQIAEQLKQEAKDAAERQAKLAQRRARRAQQRYRAHERMDAGTCHFILRIGCTLASCLHACVCMPRSRSSAFGGSAARFLHACACPTADPAHSADRLHASCMHAHAPQLIQRIRRIGCTLASFPSHIMRMPPQPIQRIGSIGSAARLPPACMHAPQPIQRIQRIGCTLASCLHACACHTADPAHSADRLHACLLPACMSMPYS